MVINESSIESLQAAVGEVASFHGRTSVNLDRNGNFVVEHQHRVGKETDETKESKALDIDRVEGSLAEIAEFDAKEVFKASRSVPWEDRFPNRLGIPDEPIVEFQVVTEKGETRTARAWLRDVEKDPGMSQLLQPLRVLVSRATEGRRFL
jgi:hypothetical protein